LHRQKQREGATGRWGETARKKKGRRVRGCTRVWLTRTGRPRNGSEL
jgi:hypothetical protein